MMTHDSYSVRGSVHDRPGMFGMVAIAIVVVMRMFE